MRERHAAGTFPSFQHVIIPPFFGTEQALRAKSIFFVIVLASLLSGCVFANRAEPTPSPAATTIPSPTPMPTAASPLAVLVLPADMDKTRSDGYQKVVYELAQGSGMRFQLRNSFTPADIEPGLKIVIALPPDPGIAALAAAAPHAQLMAIDITGLAAGGNVSTLASNNELSIPAFAAGYAAAMIGDHYRAGMILPKDNAAAQQAASAFANGMAYYCGQCSSGLIYSDPSGQAIHFPQFVQIATDTDPNLWGVNYLVGNAKLNAVYVYPDAKLETQKFFDALGQTGSQIMSVSVPASKPPGWVMAIGPDEVKAIQKAWPELVAGKGGQTVLSPLGMTEVEPSLLSPGKQRLVQQVLDDLQAGRIVTGVNP